MKRTGHRKVRKSKTAGTIFLIISLAPALLAQESQSIRNQSDGSRSPEAESVASTIFRLGAYIQPLWKDLRFEGNYFGTDENDVGYTGMSWQFRWKALRLAPGFGVAFGANGFRTMPGISCRWAYEKSWFISEGMIVQGLVQTQRFPEGSPEALAEGSVRPTITDGDHVSARWRRFIVGGAWEHIQFRENEWKGGGRVALRITARFSGVLYVMGPRAEVRGGLILHPAEEQ